MSYLLITSDHAILTCLLFLRNARPVLPLTFQGFSSNSFPPEVLLLVPSSLSSFQAFLSSHLLYKADDLFNNVAEPAPPFSDPIYLFYFNV